MKKQVKQFERYIITALLIMMGLVVFLGTIELIVILFQKIINPPIFPFLNINELLDLFGFFLIILIGIELMEATKVYLQEEVIHVEVIFLVAIIAMTRKAIILDIKETDPLAIFALATIIFSLSVGYFYLKKSFDKFILNIMLTSKKSWI